MTNWKELLNDENVTVVNRDDLIDGDIPFWNHVYLVHVTAQDIQFLVNADNAGEALDAIIDLAEITMPGLLLDEKQVEEYIQDNVIDDYTSGGNSGRYLSTFNVRIEKV